MAKTNRDDKWQAEVNDQKMCKCTTNIIKPNTWCRKVGPWKRIPPTSLAWRRPLSPSLRELIATKSWLWTRYMETRDASIYKKYKSVRNKVRNETRNLQREERQVAFQCKDKKLSYRRGTARCVVSIEILPVATQQYRNYLYDKSWPNRWYEVGDLVGGNAW